MLEALKKNTTL